MAWAYVGRFNCKLFPRAYLCEILSIDISLNKLFMNVRPNLLGQPGILR
jgi:hypothetical protein